MLPLILRLKKETHRKIARAQDMILEELYVVFNEAVIHGGTAIWRCYKGLRFSEDIDVYIERDPEKIDTLFRNLQERGFAIQKKKISQNSLYSSLTFERCSVRFEALFKHVRGILKEYETVDGNVLIVSTLSPEEFISEKIRAYLTRKKIRDLWDVFFLLTSLTNLASLKGELREVIDNYQKPVDEKDLKTILFSGLVPTSEKMLEYIKRRVNHG